MKISSNFDAGAIEFVGARGAPDGTRCVDLNIRRDSHADFRQWFYFRLQGARGVPCRLRFLNAGQCSYAEGWRDYRAVASYDRARWFRVPTSYDGHVMAVEHVPERDSVYYAYFEPYSWERHLALLGEAENSPLARVADLGNTVDGRDLNMIHVGSPGHGRKCVWVVARQHPGETMAEWFVEGMLRRLLDADDALTRELLDRAWFCIVPNMNPDGSVRGNLRTNAAGANLNREWREPNLERSPEVFVVRRKMRKTGVDLFVDVHGDEVLPYVFTDGCSMLPDFSAEQAQRERRFLDSFQRSAADFQTEHGYAPDRFTDELLTLASKHVGHTYGCLSLTLEMPFKDNANRPDARVGWNAARSQRLGEAVLQPILDSIVAA